jgi:hypothetical protein
VNKERGRIKKNNNSTGCIRVVHQAGGVKLFHRLEEVGIG